MPLPEQRRQQLDSIINQMIINKENDKNIQLVVNDFVQKYQNESVPQKKGFLEKAGDVSGKILGGLAKFSGVESAVDLGFTAGKGFAYGAERLLGSSSEEALKAVGEQPTTEIEKITTEKGLGAGIKDIAGKSLEVATTVLPFAKSAILLKAPQALQELAIQFPKIAKYSGYALKGGSYGASFATANALQENKNIINEALKGMATGALVGVAVPAVIEGTVRAIKNISSLYSGVPKEAIQRAFDNPEIVGKAVRKYASNPQNTEEILTKAENALQVIKEQRSNDYQQALEVIKNDIFITKTGPNAGRMYIKNPQTGVSTPTQFTTQGVKSELTKTLKQFNTKILSNAEQKQIGELQNLVKNWDDFTPLGLNDLRRAFRNRVVIGNSKELNAIVSRTENNLKSYINKKAPQIAEMNASYAQASEFINKLQEEIFGKTKIMKDSTKLDRLLNIFNQKSDLKQDLIKELGDKAGVDLINEITGAVMANWLPTNWVQRFVLGGAGLGAVAFSPSTIPLAISAASPRVVGKAARVLGQLNRATPAVEKFGLPATTKIINSK